MASRTERTVQVRGARLQIVESGAGKPVLLVAGWPQSLHAWRHVIPELSKSRRVLAIDPPGLGLSDPATGGADTANVAACIEELLRKLEIDEFDFVGHDIGAWLGYAYAARYPDRVRRLVLIDAAIPGITPDATYKFDAATAHRSWHFAFNFMSDLPEALITGRERAFLSWLFRSKVARLEAIGPADLDEYVRIYERPGALSAGWAYYRAIFESAEQNRTAAMTAKLDMPVMAVGGSTGLGSVMIEMVRPAADRLKGVVIDNCGHYVPEEAPEELLACLKEFLDA